MHSMRASLPSALALLLLLGVSLPLRLTAAEDTPKHTFREDALEEMGIEEASIKQKALLTFPGHSLPALLSPTEGECCQCARSVAEHILEETWNEIDAKCSNVTCPVLKKRCDWIEEHQDEFTGYLVVKIRPMTDGFFYCYGNGTCEHPPSTLADVDVFSLNSDDALISQLSAGLPLLEKGLHEARKAPDSHNPHLHLTSEMAQAADGKHLLGNVGEAPTSLSPTVESGRKCKQCLRHSVKWVLKHAIKGLKRVCEHTKCPKMQKFCEWAKEHKDFVKGMIYAKVQPWKAATGWCFGRGECGHAGAEENEEGTQMDAVSEAPSVAVPTESTSASPPSFPMPASQEEPQPLLKWAKAATNWLQERAQQETDKHARRAHKKERKHKRAH